MRVASSGLDVDARGGVPIQHAIISRLENKAARYPFGQLRRSAGSRDEYCKGSVSKGLAETLH